MVRRRAQKQGAEEIGWQRPPSRSRPPGRPVRPFPRAEVLVLGVYHMANPGRDVFNMKTDDVLAPKRQAEIVQLMRVLKAFGP
jgi:hypothetical protein